MVTRESYPPPNFRGAVQLFMPRNRTQSSIGCMRLRFGSWPNCPRGRNSPICAPAPHSANLAGWRCRTWKDLDCLPALPLRLRNATITCVTPACWAAEHGTDNREVKVWEAISRKAERGAVTNSGIGDAPMPYLPEVVVSK